jgi:hypothetical protein
MISRRPRSHDSVAALHVKSAGGGSCDAMGIALVARFVLSQVCHVLSTRRVLLEGQRRVI